jgi:cleavage stimulation factor subunit 1
MIKIFDLTRPAHNKRASHTITDVFPINTIALHPSGDYLLVGTQHKVIRLYDLSTSSLSSPPCYTAFQNDHHHQGAITALTYSNDGSIFASASLDGAIGIWDAINHRRVNLIPRAHGSAAVTSVKFSRNNRYLLTSGRDNRARLWDMRTGKRTVKIYRVT